MPESAAVATIVGLTQTFVAAEKLVQKDELVRLRSVSRQIEKRAPDLARAIEVLATNEARHERELTALGEALERWVFAMDAKDLDRPKDLRLVLSPSSFADRAGYETNLELHRSKNAEVDALAGDLIARGMPGAATLLHRGQAYYTADDQRMAIAYRTAVEALLQTGQHTNARRELALFRSYLDDLGPEGAALALDADRLEKLIREDGCRTRIDPSTGREIPSRTAEDFSIAGKQLMPPELRADLDRLAEVKRGLDANWELMLGLPAASDPNDVAKREAVLAIRTTILDERKTLERAKAEVEARATAGMQAFRDSLLKSSRLTEDEARTLARSIHLDRTVPEWVDSEVVARSAAELIRLTGGRTLATSHEITQERQVEVRIPLAGATQEQAERVSKAIEAATDRLVVQSVERSEGDIVLGCTLLDTLDQLPEVEKALAKLDLPPGAKEPQLSVAELDSPSAIGRFVDLGDTTPERLHSTLWHELAHHLEFSSGEIAAAALEWRAKNARRPNPIPLHELLQTKPEELGKLAHDLYFDMGPPSFYTGRVYPDGDATEVLSVAMPYFLDAERMVELYTENSRMFDFALGVIRTA